MTAWIVRSGRDGEREQWALTKGLAGGGFQEISDLTGATAREQVKAIIDTDLADLSVNARAIFTAQLWALRHGIQPGDLIVMPLKGGSKKIALGICTSGYQYKQDTGIERHMIGVEWKRTDLPRTALRDDLISTINGAMTVFQAYRNNAEERLRAALKTGTDPGLHGAPPAPKKGATPATTTGEPDVDVIDPTPAPTLEAIADRISQHIVEHFSQHKFTHLIADILTAHGYVCEVSPEGADGGVDIWAGRGPLGLDGPTLIVECKSESTAVGSDVVRGLSGAIHNHHGDQGLLVAWGGLNKGGKKELATTGHKIRLWEAADVLDHLFAVYEHLPADTRSRLSLTRAWVLDEETG